MTESTCTAAPGRPMLGPKDFRTYLGISKRTFETWRAAGKLPLPDLDEGRVIRWRWETVERWFHERGRRR